MLDSGAQTVPLRP